MRQNISGGSPYEPIIGFSRAVRVGNLICLAGTAPIGAESDDVEGQARRAFSIAEATLFKAGASLSDVVRTRVYLTRSEDWEAVGRVHGEYLGAARPAATFVIVSGFINPAWRLEIEMDAVLSDPSISTSTTFIPIVV